MIQIVLISLEGVRAKFAMIHTMQKKPFDARIEFVELIHNVDQDYPTRTFVGESRDGLMLVKFSNELRELKWELNVA